MSMPFENIQMKMLSFYSGGVAQNTVINSEIRNVRPNLHIPPHCNDSVDYL